MEDNNVKKNKRFAKTFWASFAAIALAFGTFTAGLSAGSWKGPAQAAENLSYNGADTRNYTLVSSTDTKTELSSYSDVYKAVENSVVSIDTKSYIEMTTYSSYYYGGMPFGFDILTPGIRGADAAPRTVSGAGSGIIFFEDDENVYIVTNFHVVDGASDCTISLDDKEDIPATYVGGDAYSDIAVISVKKSDLKAAKADYSVAVFGDSDALDIADQVMAVGNALGEGKSATLGIVSAKNKKVTIDNLTLNLLQTDAAINKGNSGGALVNMAGEVIGINTVKMSSNSIEGIGYAIPSNTIVDLLEDIMKNGTVEHPYLGIYCFTISEDDVKEYDYASAGVGIDSVLSGFNAEVMGLRSGDIITKYNGTAVKTAEQLTKLISETPIGDEIELEVVRSSTRSTGRGSSSTSTETIIIKGTMKNYTTSPEF